MDLEIIEQQLKKVPKEIKRAFFSVNTALQIQDIGKRYGLLLDQIDELVQETGLTMIGLRPATEFTSRISKELKIEEDVARKIANNINDEVLANIRKQAREAGDREQAMQTTGNVSENIQEQKHDFTAIEKAGGFTIEREENNSAIKEDTVGIVPVQNNNGYTEPMVDHLLSTPVAEPQKKVVIQANEKPAMPPITPPIQAKPTVDPYKEAIE